MARILVIDDDALMQRMLELTLDLRGHQVVQALSLIHI